MKALVLGYSYNRICVWERDVHFPSREYVSSRVAIAKVRELEALLQRGLDPDYISNTFDLAFIFEGKIEAGSYSLDWVVYINYDHASSFLNKD
jgi:hypothetical protein